MMPPEKRKNARLRRFGLLSAALFLLLPLGCQSTRESTGEGQETKVRVENRSDYMQTIYVVRGSGGTERRLGQVSPYDTETFSLPRHLVRDLTTLRFVAEPLAGFGHSVSREILVEPGDTVEMTLPGI